jgi:hypothetical protein
MNEQLVLPLQGLDPLRVSVLERYEMIIEGVTTRLDEWLDKHPKIKALFQAFSAAASVHVAIELVMWIAIGVAVLIATIH